MYPFLLSVFCVLSLFSLHWQPLVSYTPVFHYVNKQKWNIFLFFPLSYSKGSFLNMLFYVVFSLVHFFWNLLNIINCICVPWYSSIFVTYVIFVIYTYVCRNVLINLSSPLDYKHPSREEILFFSSLENLA